VRGMTLSKDEAVIIAKKILKVIKDGFDENETYVSLVFGEIVTTEDSYIKFTVGGVKHRVVFTPIGWLLD